MILEQLALVAATAFTAAAAYVNAVEQPARLDIGPRALLAQWKVSYKRATVMQVALALSACGLGLVAFASTRDWLWLLGALLMLGMLPYTFVVLMPTNRRLMATPPEAADDRIRAEVQRWGRLHAGRTALGFLVVAIYVGRRSEPSR